MFGHEYFSADEWPGATDAEAARSGAVQITRPQGIPVSSPRCGLGALQ